MKNVRLIRLEEDFNFGTFGVLLIDGRVFCVTLEPADLNNHPNISSIPAQQYMCRRYSSPKYPNTFHICDVPERSSVLFHAGNTIGHTQGCVLLAQYYGKLFAKNDEKRAVLNSGKTFDEFIKRMIGTEEFHLTIKEHY